MSVISISTTNRDPGNTNRYVSINPMDDSMIGTNYVTIKFKYMKEEFFYNEIDP